MLPFTPNVDKEFILRHLTQEEIFSKYLCMQVEVGDYFCSPLREDKNPTCSLRYTPDGRVYMKDWSGHFEGDCFNLVQFLYGCNFYEACNIIAEDFNLIKGNRTPVKKKIINQTSYHKKSVFKFRWRKWSERDIEYWEGFGITEPLLLYYKVAPVKELWIDDKLVYCYKEKDPAYAYYFGNDQWKVYFPKRDSFRFLCNTTTLQGLKQLPNNGEICLITKSLKDVMVLYNFGIPAVAPQAESVIIAPEEWDGLRYRFKYLYSLYDFDLTGVRSANKMRKYYGIKPIFLTTGKYFTEDYAAKDVSDLYKNKGARSVFEFLQNNLRSSK